MLLFQRCLPTYLWYQSSLSTHILLWSLDFSFFSFSADPLLLLDFLALTRHSISLSNITKVQGFWYLSFFPKMVFFQQINTWEEGSKCGLVSFIMCLFFLSKVVSDWPLLVIVKVRSKQATWECGLGGEKKLDNGQWTRSVVQGALVHLSGPWFLISKKRLAKQTGHGISSCDFALCSNSQHLGVDGMIYKQL